MQINITSLGKLAGELQTLPMEIKDIAREIGVEPTITINDCPFFDEGDVSRIVDRLRQQAPPREPIQDVG